MLAGPVILKLKNTAPVTMKGEWNFRRGIPVTRHYGQGRIGDDGNVEPGSGYLGGNKGTMQSVSGSCKFAVDDTGVSVAQLLRLQAGEFIPADWPIGDMASASVRAKAIDCHFDDFSFEHDGPNGRYEITATLSAGELQFTGL